MTSIVLYDELLVTATQQHAATAIFVVSTVVASLRSRVSRSSIGGGGR